jgi:hypothetical protein
MYKPLHTVSGDFYMVEESKDHIVLPLLIARVMVFRVHL